MKTLTFGEMTQTLEKLKAEGKGQIEIAFELYQMGYEAGATDQERGEVLDGTYYLLDCLDGIIGDKLLTPEGLHELMDGKSETYSEKEILSIARNYEASLYRYKYIKGREVDSSCLYDCGY